MISRDQLIDAHFMTFWDLFAVETFCKRFGDDFLGPISTESVIKMMAISYVP